MCPEATQHQHQQQQMDGWFPQHQHQMGSQQEQKPGLLQAATQQQQQEDLCCSASSSLDGSIKPTPPFDCSQYSMMFFKVLPCQKKYNHDWTACPGAHPGERARRRCLLVYRYGAKVCPDMQTRGTCPRGESCYMTHGMFEYYMHPLKYKTKMCKSGPTCRRHYCFFSHAPEELRESSSIPDEWQLQVLADGSVSSSSTAAVLSCLPLEARGSAQAAIAQLPQIMTMFESRDRGSTQHAMPVPAGTYMQGMSPAWGSSSLASSGSQFDAVPGMLAQAEGAFGGSPVVAGPQHAFNTLQQQQQQPQHQEFLQYGPACGLPSSNNPQALGGVVMVPQQQPGSGQHGMLLMPPQQLGPAAAAVPQAYLQAGAGLAPGSWAAARQPGVSGSSTAMVGSPPILQAPANMLAPAQGGMFLQAGPSGPMQPYPQVPPGALMQPQQQQQQHQASNMRPPGMQLPQQQQQQPAVSVPLSSTMLMHLQQHVQPQSQSQSPAQLPRAQVLPDGGELACLPPPADSAANDQLLQQLQALGLSTAAM